MKSKRLAGKKVLIFVEKFYNDLELHYPRLRLIEEGAHVSVAGPKAKEIYLSKYDFPCEADIAFQDAKEKEFDALVIPGGYAPDRIRRDENAVELVRQFHQKGKPIAFICHAGWVLISANILKGVKCTSFSSIKDDMINAGAKWVDEPVVVDRHFISSRDPDDLPNFCPALIEMLASSK
jgi:protease I